LGDKDQLASVEAGAVLGDICNSGSNVAYSRTWNEELARLTGEPLPMPLDAPQVTGIWDCIVQLRHSYRSEKAPAIAALAAAINRGDAGEALRLLASDEASYLSWQAESGKGKEIGAAMRREIIDGFSRYLEQTHPEEQLHLLDHFRLLCAHRRGPRGCRGDESDRRGSSRGSRED
jgi:exodeoxyribonuclease V alpha subunit